MSYGSSKPRYGSSWTSLGTHTLRAAVGAVQVVRVSIVVERLMASEEAEGKPSLVTLQF